jgi:outer membrane protein TolC
MTTEIYPPSIRLNNALNLSTACNLSVEFPRCILCSGKNSHQFNRQSARLIAMFALFALSLPLHAQSFTELEDMLKEHPQLQTMSYQADSNRQSSDAAMGLPDPVISLGINNFPIFDPSFSEFLPTNKAIGVQQRFPSRIARKARSAIGQAEAMQFDEKHKQLFSAMRAELIALLHNKTRIQSQRLLAQQRDTKYDQLIDAVESAVQGGRPSVFRLAEIESERAEVARTLIDLEAQTAQADARLLYLVGVVPVTTPPVILADVWSGDRMNFYASRVADAAVKISDGGIDAAKAAWKPEWGAQLLYQQREAGRNFAGDDWASMMVTFTVPFWSNKKQAPALRAAKAKKAAAQATLQDAMRQSTAQYTYSKAVHLAADKAKLILQQKISAISDEITAQRANYESGAGDYTAVIDGEIAILKLRAEIATEQTRGDIAAAQMNALVVMP